MRPEDALRSDTYLQELQTVIPHNNRIRKVQPDSEHIYNKGKFKDKSVGYRLKNLYSYLGIPYPMIYYIIKAHLRKDSLNKPFEPHKINDDFFGINVAFNPDTRMDDYFIDRLKDLGLRSVRTDYAYDSSKANVDRWIDRLISDNYEIIIHFVQPTSDSSNMYKPEAVRRWKDFMQPVIEKYHKTVQEYEIGSTPNRQSWSGYTIRDYVETVKYAKEIADKYGVKILGPNTSDYAPYFIVSILHNLKKLGINFSMITDNLFVDRADQPEEYDKHVAIDLLKNVFKMNLVNKCRSINNIAKIYGFGPPICTFVDWRVDNNEIKRRHAVSEDKYADYLVRYYLLVAASGLLKRVYWGPILNYHYGIIDDAVNIKFYPPLVYLQHENCPTMEHYRIRPGYYSYRFLINMLKDSSFKRVVSTPETTFIYEFGKDDKPFYTAWNIDGMTDNFLNYHEIPIENYDIFTREGEKTDSTTISESPIYVVKKSQTSKF